MTFSDPKTHNSRIIRIRSDQIELFSDNPGFFSYLNTNGSNLDASEYGLGHLDYPDQID